MLSGNILWILPDDLTQVAERFTGCLIIDKFVGRGGPDALTLS